MDRRMKQQAALYMLITLIDDCGGSIEINSDKIHRFYNDENQVVKVEHTDGTTALAADLDVEEVFNATLKWPTDNPRTFETIKSKVDKKFNDMIPGFS